MEYSKYHKSPYTNAAIVLSIIGFCLNCTVAYALYPALICSIIVYMTGCCKVHQKCLYVAVALSLLSSICAFVVLAATNYKVLRIMSIFGGLVWMVNTYVIYKIPAPDPTVPDSDDNRGAPAMDHPTV